MRNAETLDGVGAISKPDGSRLEGVRRYSFLLVPRRVELPDSDPVAVGSWVELRGQEPLDLEGQHLVLTAIDRRRLRFRIIDVSETPPHLHTIVVDGWPEDALVPESC
jgi:hypothetical protein